MIPCTRWDAITFAAVFVFNCEREIGIHAKQVTQIVCLSALLQVPLEGEASQFAQILSILAFEIAAFALVAAASLGCINHALPEPPAQTLRSLARPSGTSGRSALQAAEIWVCPCLHPDPLAGGAKPCADIGVGKPYFICHLFAPNYGR